MYRIITTILFLIFFAFIYSCNSKQEYVYTINKKADSTLSPQQLNKIVSEIAEEDKVYEDHTGYGGGTSNQYSRFDSLKKFATTSQLINLTKHKNVAVQVYAFMALERRNYSDIKIILEQSLNNTQTFIYFPGGCMGGPHHVNIFFLEQLESSLSKRDYANYKLNNN